MNKAKAVVCTALLVFVISLVMAVSMLVKSEAYGFTLYQILTGAITNLWIGNCIHKFYNWLTK